MSQYLIRHIEARYERIDGATWAEKDIPNDMPDGTIWRVNQKMKYLKRINSKWEEILDSEIERGWQLLKTYGTGTAGHSTSDYRKITVENDGKKLTLLENDSWSNNGGAIRDDYISDQFSIVDCPFSGRGVPEDVSKETLEAMTYDGQIRGYKHTWATINEWNVLYESEQTRIMNLLIEKCQKKLNKGIVKRLDFIIDNMRDPMSMDSEFRGDENEEEEDDFQYVIEDEMPKLYLIAQEIAKADLIAEQNGLFSSDIRIIYYIE